MSDTKLTRRARGVLLIIMTSVGAFAFPLILIAGEVLFDAGVITALIVGPLMLYGAYRLLKWAGFDEPVTGGE